MHPKEEFIFDKKIKVWSNHNHLAKSMSKLSDSGRLFCLMHQAMFFGEEKKRY